MAKKILTILTTALCCVSCAEHTIREHDAFVVKSIELSENIKKVHNYTYLYHLYWLQKYHGYDKAIIEEVYYYSNEKYELGDTLRLFNTNEIKFEKK